MDQEEQKLVNEFKTLIEAFEIQTFSTHFQPFVEELIENTEADITLSLDQAASSINSNLTKFTDSVESSRKTMEALVNKIDLNLTASKNILNDFSKRNEVLLSDYFKQELKRFKITTSLLGFQFLLIVLILLHVFNLI